ncbi:uncharacterized protein LOC135081481 isoform X1 [Ostrinia nubilalis]|uniref:uncharacterized protein LOC135081481 isoform X1 n=1 Tax=Ostrinia nubilalis TaxID=29057 RepID=UPI003082634D
MKRCKQLFVIVMTCLVVQCAGMSISELEDFANFLQKTSKLDETLKKGTDPNDFDEDEVVSDHAWEESGKFEGDLILNERQRRMIVEDIAEGLSRNGLRDSTKRWPDNEVIYFIQKEHFSGDQVDAIRNGIEDIARASCIKFRPYRKGDRDAVVIQGSRRGCFSQVGYQGGYQVLNLSGRHPVGRGCFRHGTVVHELLHTLGFYHMQSSPDRDDYVDIVWENIVQPARHNFRKYNAFSVSDFGVGYDYDSVLHYSKRAFSSNGQDTIVPKQGAAQIGQRVGLSDKDTQKLNKMYCDADSGNNDEEESTTHRATIKKKRPKNKPFDGHGIGYHQGKTVVIKLLPAPETYNINKPAFPMFDYFSKTQQVLSPKEIPGYGSGKRIADLYTPYKEDYASQGFKEVQDLNSFHTPDGTNDNSPKNIANDMKPTTDISDENKNPAPSQNEKEATSSETDDKDLNDAFKRLEKILKTHVYHTHVPDLTAYKVNTDYSEFADPTSLPKIAEDFIDHTHSKEDVKDKETSEYIKSLYINGPASLYSEEPQKKFERLQNPKEMYEFIPNNEHNNDPTVKEALYRTAYPFKVHQHFSNGSLEIKTPEYARYENLKDKHNYSRLYDPSVHENDNELKRKYALFGVPVPTYENWYQKDYLKRNPVDYDKESYNYGTPPVGSHQNIVIEEDQSGSTEQEADNTSKYSGSFSPQLKQPYSLFGARVPLTNNWYKVDSEKLIEYYPHKHYQSKDSESNEDNR